MSRTVPRVCLYGLFGIGNLGNEASLAALLLGLRDRQPDAQVTCLSAHPAAVLTEHGVPGTSLMAFSSAVSPAGPVKKILGRVVDVPRTLRLVGRADLVVVPGMGVLEETLGTKPWGLPYWLFLATLSCRLRGRRLALVSIGVDTPRNPLNRLLFRATLRLAHYRTYRDTLSREAAAALGVTAGPEDIRPDLAFALPLPVLRPVVPGRVALGVMAYYGRDDDPVRGGHIRARYVEQLTVFVARLLEAGRSITLVIGDGVDREIADQIRDGVLAAHPEFPPEGVRVAAANTLDDLMAEMSAAEVVIGSRFHNVLSALRLAKPTISIAYAPKNDELMACFGLGEYCQTIESLDVELLELQLGEVLVTHPDRESRMRELIDHYTSDLDRQFDLLFPPAIHSPEVVHASSPGSSP